MVRYRALLLAAGVVLGAGPDVLVAQTWMREALQEPTTVTASMGAASRNGGGADQHTTWEGNFTASAGLIYTDNVTLSPDGRGALSSRLGLDCAIDVPLTVNNTFHLQLAAARTIYLSGEGDRQGFQSITPGSNLGFDLYVGRAKIRSFLNLSLREDPVESVVVNGIDRFGLLNIDAGTQLDWDLNRLVLQGLVLAGRQWHIAGDGSLGADRFAVALRPYFPRRAGGGWGLSIGTSETQYRQKIQNDQQRHDFGVFAQQMLSRTMRVQGEVGWSQAQFDQSGVILDQDDYAGAYGVVQLDHQVRRALRYSLLARREVQVGIGSNYFVVNSITLVPQLALGRLWHLDSTFAYESIDESGPLGESATRSSMRFLLKRPLSSRLRASLEYQYVNKRSDVASRSYTRNRCALQVDFTF